jgi:hypothetical protein
MNKAKSFSLRPLKTLLTFIVLGIIASTPNVSQAKESNEQDQIILLNDSASALEDINPGLSKMLAQYANEQEKDWENKNASKKELPAPITDKYKKLLQGRIKLLKAAAMAIQPTYPLIAKALDKMAKDLGKTIEEVPPKTNVNK